MTIKQRTKRVMEVAAKLPPLVDHRRHRGAARTAAPSSPAAPASGPTGLTASR